VVTADAKLGQRTGDLPQDLYRDLDIAEGLVNVRRVATMRFGEHGVSCAEVTDDRASVKQG
jgi:hypothetical protein